MRLSVRWSFVVMATFVTWAHSGDAVSAKRGRRTIHLSQFRKPFLTEALTIEIGAGPAVVLHEPESNANPHPPPTERYMGPLAEEVGALVHEIEQPDPDAKTRGEDWCVDWVLDDAGRREFPQKKCAYREVAQRTAEKWLAGRRPQAPTACNGAEVCGIELTEFASGYHGSHMLAGYDGTYEMRLYPDGNFECHLGGAHGLVYVNAGRIEPSAARAAIATLFAGIDVTLEINRIGDRTIQGPNGRSLEMAAFVGDKEHFLSVDAWKRVRPRWPEIAKSLAPGCAIPRGAH